MDVTALLEPYLTPANPPLDLSEVLALGLLGDQVRTFHVCGVGNTTTNWADLWPSQAGSVVRERPAEVRLDHAWQRCRPYNRDTVPISSTHASNASTIRSARR